MSDTTKDYLLKFWSLIDDILNAALFLLIGLEGVALSWTPGLLLAGLLAVPMILLARLLSTAPILALWRRRLPLRLSVPILTWGALRGGISIALALSLPAGPMKDLIVATTYVVVLFSVVVQGSTMAGLVRRLPPPWPWRNSAPRRRTGRRRGASGLTPARPGPAARSVSGPEAVAARSSPATAPA